MADTVNKSAILKWRSVRGGDLPGLMKCGKKVFHWGERTFVMGVVNLSPDSFSGDGLDSTEKALAQCYRFIDDGVDFLDIGGESTRPGFKQITVEEEINRVVPLIKELAGKIDIPISIDTYKLAVTRAALDAGADVVNDIKGLKYEPELARLTAERNVPIILMSYQRDEPLKEIVPGVIADLKRAIDVALDAGIKWENIIIDPGIGFGKTLQQNYELIRRLDELKILGRPILLGTSRKSMIGLTLNLPEDQRLEGTAATNAIGIANGADIIRVHDVKAMIRVAQMSDAIVRTKI